MSQTIAQAPNTPEPTSSATHSDGHSQSISSCCHCRRGFKTLELGCELVDDEDAMKPTQPFLLLLRLHFGN
ncbi:MAG TPA: hypothetical protein V6D06_17415, partial [Trichocoleus sp.]